MASVTNPLASVRRIGRPLSLKHRSKFKYNDRLETTFDMALMPWDYCYRVHDFDQALDTNYWTTAVTAGGAPTAFAVNVQRGGAIRGAAGTSTNGVSAVYSPFLFDAADKPFGIIRFKAPAAVTSMVIECGFASTPTDTKLVNVSDIDTPAFGNGVTDAGVIVIDTAQTLTTMAVAGVGTSTTALASNTFKDENAVANSAYTPTASKWIEAVISVSAATTYARLYDTGVEIGSAQVASGPDVSVLMGFYFLIKTLNTTTKTIDIDQIVLGCERNATT